MLEPLECAGGLSRCRSGHYVPGVMNIRDYAAAPPGLFVVWYNWFVSSDIRTSTGTAPSSRASTPARSIRALPDVDVDLELKGFATVPALVSGRSTFTLSGWGPVSRGSVHPTGRPPSFTFVAEPGGPGFDPSEGAVQSRAAFRDWSDLFVAPVGLSWALGQFDATFFYGFTAPTGRYTTGADDNIGLGFWTHQFQGFGYFYPDPGQATALMLGLTYEINSEIEGPGR